MQEWGTHDPPHIAKVQFPTCFVITYYELLRVVAQQNTAGHRFPIHSLASQIQIDGGAYSKAVILYNLSDLPVISCRSTINFADGFKPINFVDGFQRKKGIREKAQVFLVIKEIPYYKIVKRDTMHILISKTYFADIIL